MIQIRSKIHDEWWQAFTSLFLLILFLSIDYLFNLPWFDGSTRFAAYFVTVLPVGLPILFKGIKLALKGEVFTEFFLMSLATFGAFYIAEYPEGVAVMVFYAIGELLQGAAVRSAKRNIKALLEIRPDIANVKREGRVQTVHPSAVAINETIQVRTGERVPLDAVITESAGTFNAAALTGESIPVSIGKGGQVLAGMINESSVIELKVNKTFENSAVARIISMVENAQGRKAKTELFIRRFAKVYTPIVVAGALAVLVLPYFFADQYTFNDWLYRALVFLVISCPCALVVAIPLGYFGGVGAGSRNGILFKGSSYLDRMTRVKTVVMDKTGTLTKGSFRVKDVVSFADDKHVWLPMVAALESKSTHPIAKAIISHVVTMPDLSVDNVQEFKGQGLNGLVDGKRIKVGNAKFIKEIPKDLAHRITNDKDTQVWVVVDGNVVGLVTIADEVKEDALTAVRRMHSRGIKTIILSGDKQSVVNDVAARLGIVEAYGDLLPEDKVSKFEDIKARNPGVTVFVGDGINDAPVLALSDVGIVMGKLGSDASIETADVVLQTDQPSKILTAIDVGKRTQVIVWQNITLAFVVKALVMMFGAFGAASLWEAVFADVGVALLAILNAIRIQKMKF